MGKTSAAVHNRYNAKAYEQVRFLIPMGNKEHLKAAADAAGESINAYVGRAVLERMGRDAWPVPPLSQGGGEGETIED